ncbi:MAG TPA: TetR/AcrR family transcriptional regulator [Candidatus Dormibacteraeota bacterium]
MHSTEDEAAGGAVDDPLLLDAALRALAAWGWEGMTLDRIASEAGRSRVTLWRQGVRRDGISAGLLLRLAASHRQALWPVVTSTGTPRARLEDALAALCRVADDNLVLLSGCDTAFHDAETAGLVPRGEFSRPLERILRDGVADGTLRPGSSPEETASVLFNAVCWTHVHLRARHRWSPERARRSVLGLVLHGVVADQAPVVPKSRSPKSPRPGTM